MKTAFAIVILIFATELEAQVGKDSGLWQFVDPVENHEAIVMVTLDGGMGTGAVVRVTGKETNGGFEGYVLTAYHAVSSDQGRRAIKVTYQDGSNSHRSKVVHFDEKSDIALVWVWVPPGIEAFTVAENPIVHGDQFQIAGFGGANGFDEIRFFKAKASRPTDENIIYADCSLIPGDSGGPLFSESGKIVGVVSGGWFWWDGDVVMSDGRSIKMTWPSRCCNTRPIQTLMAELDK